MRALNIILGEARRALAMTQREFGLAVGSSHRTAVRWDAGQSSPAGAHLLKLAKLLYPRHRSLAAEVAEALGTTLVGIGLEAPAPAPGPPIPVLAPAPLFAAEDLVDIVVLAVVERFEVTPSVARSLLHAAFKRASEIGLTVEATEKALRPAPQSIGKPTKDAIHGKDLAAKAP